MVRLEGVNRTVGGLVRRLLVTSPCGALTLVIFIAFTDQAAARGLIASPSQLGLTAKARGSVSATITVASSVREENRVRVSIVDFTRTEAGALELLPAGGGRRSARSWLSVAQSEFVSPRSGSVELRLTARIPAEASGSYWAAVVLKSIPPPGPTRKLGFQIVPQVAIPVIVTVAGTEHPDVRIDRIVAHRNQGKGIQSEATINNVGNVAVMVVGAFTVERVGADGQPEELAQADIPPTVSLPGVRTRVNGVLAYEGRTSGAKIHALIRYGAEPDQFIDRAGDIADREAPGRSENSGGPRS